ncbi:hypothetical protein ACQ4LE_007219 [Meloidogyne hapla]
MGMIENVLLIIEEQLLKMPITYLTGFFLENFFLLIFIFKRNGSGTVTDYATSNLRPFASDRNMNMAPELQTARSREEEEEELMNRILDRTQQVFIFEFIFD